MLRQRMKTATSSTPRWTTTAINECKAQHSEVYHVTQSLHTIPEICQPLIPPPRLPRRLSQLLHWIAAALRIHFPGLHANLRRRLQLCNRLRHPLPQGREEFQFKAVTKFGLNGFTEAPGEVM